MKNCSALVCFALLWPRAAAQLANPSARLEVTVLDGSGQGVEAECVVESLLGAPVRLRASPEGRCDFALPPGHYRLTVRRGGFDPTTVTVELPTGTVRRTVRLRLGIMTAAIDVVAATPIPGLNAERADLASPVQTLHSLDFEHSGALELADLLNRRLDSIHLNETQGNPLQPDLNFRGYTASPLLGTPPGLSIYLDGVRLNQPFGDTVSWDLIPAFAIAEIALIPGSNPVFGSNTLGGSLALATKDGRRFPGSRIQTSGGSFGRTRADWESGGARRSFDWYLAGSLFSEDGWRNASNSNARQWFSRLSRQGLQSRLSLSLGYAHNALLGNGLQEFRLLEADYRSVYTKPDLTANRSPWSTLNGQHTVSPRLALSGVAYFRHLRTRTLNGDINERSLRENLYQPDAREQAALRSAGFSGFPTAGETAANTPFPFWRCLAQALLGGEPGETCNGLLNTSATRQAAHGAAAQLFWLAGSSRWQHRLTAGGTYDASKISFRQTTELGFLLPDRSVSGIGAFADGVTGGTLDGQPLDNRADLLSRMVSGSLFFADSLFGPGRWRLHLSGRFNRTAIDNRDQIRPLPGTGSLTGRHIFSRLHPSVGWTQPWGTALTAFVSYSESGRAPTSIELGCADPQAPCRLPNALASDPPLRPVVTRTIEAGIRSANEGRWQWRANWFRATNQADILFVASEQTGFGYFRNFGRTLRQGVETSLATRIRGLFFRSGYTFLQATFRSAETVNGTGNSSNDQAAAGFPGVDGVIQIGPGDRIPLLPAHLVRAYADWQVTARWRLQATALGASSSIARGNENNQHSPDGVYYLGQGYIPGYVVLHGSVSYLLGSRLELFIQANNLLDQRYLTAAQLGPTGFLADGRFLARAFPPRGEEYPVPQSTFVAPSAPRSAWAGLRFRF